MIDFDFTDEQRALAATARELFAKESPPERLRAIWEGAEPDPQVWRTMASVGLTGITVAQEHSGLGGDEIDLALVLEEVGYAALPEPLMECALAARALQDPDTLRAIAEGTMVALEQVGPFTPDADRAAVVVLGGRAHRRFDAERVASLDHGRRLFRVTPADAGEATRADAHRSAWATASVLNGVSMRLLDMTVSYAKERRQFGAPIGSFQAVKHELATGHALLTAARAAAHGAAYAIARATEDHAFSARVAATEARAAHEHLNRAALQIHAGIGFTWEHDLHFWLKRGLGLAGVLTPAATRVNGGGRDA